MGIFSFFSSTNVETKNVCPIAYNICINASLRLFSSKLAFISAISGWFSMLQNNNLYFFAELSFG